MKILLIGSGAREHAIARTLHRSPLLAELYAYTTSHHPGIIPLTTQYRIGDIANIQDIVSAATHWQIDLAIIGPEAPLAQGLADALWHVAIPVIGPTKSLARIETSKAFARELLQKYQIPGAARYQFFHDMNGVEDLLRDLGARWDSETRQWLIKPAKLAKAVQIVAGDYALAGYDSEEEKTPSPTKCKKCGIQARPRQGAAPAIVIYGSGECKGCYLDRKESEQTDSRGNGRGFSGGGLYR